MQNSMHPLPAGAKNWAVDDGAGSDAPSGMYFDNNGGTLKEKKIVRESLAQNNA